MSERDIWNKRYGDGGHSGASSYGTQLLKKLFWIKENVTEDIKSIAEIGCGDFNFGKRVFEMYPTATYAGFDVSDYIVYKNKYFNPEHTFEVWNNYLPPNDLLLFVDVIFHILDDEELEKTLKLIESSWTKYLVVTAYEHDEEKHNHVRIRKFDYKRFGEPIVREIIENDGQMYFYIFKKDGS